MDEKILQALKKYNQYHSGLSCEIKSIQYFHNNNAVIIQLELQNNDSYNYYYLDPEKMRLELYHYFTLISLEYNNFDTIPPGQFKAFFGFPGLSYQVDREKIQHDNSRIWPGELQLIKDIDIE